MAEDFAAELARMQADCLAGLREAMPRSEMGRALMAELAAEEARERASRRCSDCVHFGEDDHRVGPVPYCDLNRWPAGSLRECFRTAASCDDYEEVDDSEEGVG